MARLDIERQKQLEPTRIEYAVSRIQELGFEIVQRDNTQIQFIHKGQTVTFFPYSGWATGKSIEDGRGLERLLKQLRP
ncbi:hypothetical protein [Phocaeicola vulgatus]|uniref:hypothetical protein n=1 Tax=Phocaeicola vulgatus TaxID=821 RepID=UPI003567E5AF